MHKHETNMKLAKRSVNVHSYCVSDTLVCACQRTFQPLSYNITGELAPIQCSYLLLVKQGTGGLRYSNLFNERCWNKNFCKEFSFEMKQDLP